MPQPPTETSFPRSPLLMSRHDSALVVVDVQEKLVPHIPRHTQLSWNIGRLLQAANLLDIASFISEQYPRGLGHTVSAVADHFSGEVSEKSIFSCLECRDIIDALNEATISKVLLTGIETHVCVQQTALDFIALGFDVYLAVDAIGSRNALDHQTALRRMEACGVHLLTTETAMFEWCETSTAAEFKSISQLVKQSPPPNLAGIG